MDIMRLLEITIANTISASSHPKALTILSRTKHLRQTAMKEKPRKIVVTMKIDKLRPSKCCIVMAGVKDCINRNSSSLQGKLNRCRNPLQRIRTELRIGRRRKGREAAKNQTICQALPSWAISGEKGGGRRPSGSSRRWRPSPL